MGNHSGPLESLAAFAICFVVGAVSACAMQAYILKLKREAVNE